MKVIFCDIIFIVGGLMKKIIKKLISSFQDMDKPLFYITLCFFILGLLAIVSASSREAVVRYGATLYHYFFK